MPEALIIDDGRNPFQWWLLAACVLTGAAGLVPGSRVRSAVIELVPAWAGHVWYGGLLISGLAGLLAMLLRLPTCLHVERAALLMLAAQLTGYGISVFVITGGELSAGLGPMLAAAVACVARIWLITRRDLPRVRRAFAALAERRR